MMETAPVEETQEAIAKWLERYAEFTEQDILKQAALMVRGGQWRTAAAPVTEQVVS